MPGRNQPRSSRGRSAIARRAINTNSTNGVRLNNGGGVKKCEAHPSATGFMRAKPWKISIPASRKNYIFNMNINHKNSHETLHFSDNNPLSLNYCLGKYVAYCGDPAITDDCSHYYSIDPFSSPTKYVQCKGTSGKCVLNNTASCTRPPLPYCWPGEWAPYQAHSCYFNPRKEFPKSAKPCNMYVGLDDNYTKTIKCAGPDNLGYCYNGDTCSDTSCNYGECSNGNNKGCYLDSSNNFCCTDWSKEDQGCWDSKKVCKKNANSKLCGVERNDVSLCESTH